jgi:hypothetical protein
MSYPSPYATADRVDLPTANRAVQSSYDRDQYPTRAADVPQVNAELRRLREVAETSRKTIEDLRGRLECVSRPLPRPDHANGQGQNQACEPLCPLAQEIRVTADIVEDGTHVLRTVLAALGI